VKVYGIELWNQPKDSVVSFGKQMGVTFPLLTQGYQTSQAYGAQNNDLYLIDKNGTIQGISTIPGASVTYTQINNAVKAIADKIPGLLSVAIRFLEPVPQKTALPPALSLTRFSYDLRGRIVSADPMNATQLILLRNRFAPVRKVPYGELK
jgi:hypothetical protein